MDLRFFSWNLNARTKGATVFAQLRLLQAAAGNCPTVVALQELTPEADRLLREEFGPAEYLGSLALRPPMRYETANRMRGCGLLALNGLQLFEPRLVPETPLPERTLTARVVGLGDPRPLVGSFHAITGVGYGHAKPIMFQALARFLEDQAGPVVFGIDRNTPKHDRFPLESTEWWWPQANHEPLMFGHEAVHTCRDALHDWLEQHPEEVERIRAERPEGPLAVTHLRGPKKAPSRYDAVYASPHWRVVDVEHDFGDEVRELTDHALVRADLAWAD